jgi:hypothetical protein
LTKGIPQNFSVGQGKLFHKAPTVYNNYQTPRMKGLLISWGGLLAPPPPKELIGEKEVDSDFFAQRSILSGSVVPPPPT